MGAEAFSMLLPNRGVIVCLVFLLLKKYLLEGDNCISGLCVCEHLCSKSG